MPDPATEVIACPACRHVVRVPVDWLGQAVQCPECRATFTAPVRENGRLTEPVLVSTPAPSPRPAPERPGSGLILPGVGLILVGLASLALNGWVVGRFLRSPDGGKEIVRDMIPQLRQFGALPPPGDDPAADEKAAAEVAPKVFWAVSAGVVLAGLTVAGGVSLVRRRNPRLALLGCAAAAVNLPGGCCVPGAVVGLWGVLAALGDGEFVRPREPAA